MVAYINPLAMSGGIKMEEKMYVEIVESHAFGTGYKEKPETVVNRMGPMSQRKAERVERGAQINMNHDKFFTRIVGE